MILDIEVYEHDTATAWSQAYLNSTHQELLNELSNIKFVAIGYLLLNHTYKRLNSI